MTLTRKLFALKNRVKSLVYLDHRVAEATHAASVAAARLEVVMREQRLLARQLTTPPSELWAGGPQPISRDAVSGLVTGRSAACRQDSLETSWFTAWMQRFGYAPRYHRKLWEFAFIGQALEERGMLHPGAKGLGFGVGGEPLSAYFASRGCDVLATDMAPDAPGASDWSATGQHARGKETLRLPSVCPDGVFDEHVQFRYCDMNNIPAALAGFDFCWSACALEHLGSLEAGFTFMENTLACLAPGGVSVHTTELNISGSDTTLTSGPTVLYRRRDFEAFAARLTGLGFDVAPFDFELGDRPLDWYVDFPPYLDAPHLRVAVEGYPSTSIAIVITKSTGQRGTS